MLVAILLLVADLSHFVDQPTFALPARNIRWYLSRWRLASLLVVSSMCIRAALCNRCPDPPGLARFELWLIPCTLIFYTLRLSPMIRHVGDDLHTTARSGNCHNVDKLLTEDKDGQVLDVNGKSKERLGMTPVMIGAKCGHLDIVEMLVEAGANLDLQNEEKNTCIHLAVQSRHLEICQYLHSKGANCQLRNCRDELPSDLLPQEDSWSFLLDRPLEESHEPMSYSVQAQPIGGDDLRALFPDAADDDALSPEHIQSVSGLILSRAVGLLARRCLRVREASGGITPQMLKHVGDVETLVGKGGFARVIKVETPSVTGRNGQFYALKLQEKQVHRAVAASEVLALKRVSHPFIVHLYNAYQTPKFFAFLLEYCPTDLNRLLCSTEEDNRCLGLRERDGARFMGQILLALTHLHCKYIHRDIKPENILISDQNNAKLTDFGLVQEATSNESLVMSGTMGFIAPELVTRSYSISDQREVFKQDAYSFGVTLQLTLLGEDGARKSNIPGKGNMLLPLFMNEVEMRGVLDVLCDAGRLSEAAHHLLVEHLLPYRPADRSALSDEKVLQHRFFLEALECKSLEEALMRRQSRVFGRFRDRPQKAPEI